MLYQIYEMNHAAVAPFRAAAHMGHMVLTNPLNPFAHTPFGRQAAAACEVFETITRRYGKPAFGLDETMINAQPVAVSEEIVWRKPFCQLKHFKRDPEMMARFKHSANDPTLLIVAPLSGHYATLLRGTVEAMLPEHDVFITDWRDARMAPLSDGAFDLDDYVDYVIEILQFLHGQGRDVHVMGVCQPSVPVLAAVSVMEKAGDPAAPCSMTLMGGPIDTRESPTQVNDLATERGIDWFRQNVIMTVPFPHPGFMRRVYPGFLQLSGFMSMNLDRHVDAHRDFFFHLVEGDGDSAEAHRTFYDEYLSVMDMTEEFYLQTVEKVFIEHELPRGTFHHRDELVDPGAVRRTALMTVEGEKDDISGIGQTKAAHTLCHALSEDMRVHYEQPGVGHYGVFNGSRWRTEIAPRVRDFIRSHRKRPKA